MSTLRSVPSLLVVSALSLGAVGCSFAKRSPKMYSQATTELIQTKSGELKACYDAVLKGDENTAGSVTVFFVLEKDTGVVKDVEVQDSTVPPEIQACVESSLQGLVLKPGDADDGHATITFVFEPGPKPPPPPAPAAPPPAPAEQPPPAPAAAPAPAGPPKANPVVPSNPPLKPKG